MKKSWAEESRGISVCFNPNLSGSKKWRLEEVIEAENEAAFQS